MLYSILVALPTPPGLAWQGQRVLGVAALAIGLWCTEVLPTGVTSMLVLLLLVLSGGVPGFREALAGFAEPVTYFLMAVLTLGLAVLRSGLVVMIAGDAVLYYPAQSASSLVVYERGHLSAPEIFRFGVWMTLVAYIVVLTVALP
jgi:sodium-dependent dicarboxylate transporter 2/3/5